MPGLSQRALFACALFAASFFFGCHRHDEPVAASAAALEVSDAGEPDDAVAVGDAAGDAGEDSAGPEGGEGDGCDVGTGAAGDPFLIESCACLQAMERDLYAHYRLTRDLDCADFDAGDGLGFRPIGGFGGEPPPFHGHFDGGGHVVRNLRAHRPARVGVGLFGGTHGATIERIGLEGVSFSGAEKAGGLVGIATWTTISESFATGSVAAGVFAGGLVGYAWESDVRDSYSDVLVSGGYYDAGVVVGVSNASSFAQVYGRGASAGAPLAFVGWVHEPLSPGAFFDCDVAGRCDEAEAARTTDLQDEAFLVAAAFDTVAVWGFRGPSTYACLRWESGCGDSSECAANDATCDGIDDDCDGLIDDDFAPEPTSCGVGGCGATGATSCVDGAVVDSCLPGTAAANDATCDGIDDDCDGLVDEDFAPEPTSCGVGACGATGATSCVDGAVVDSCLPGTAAANDATCDGIDDDCDGLIDEDFAPEPTACGVGACGATGLATCHAGMIVDGCTPGAPSGADDDCNGIDDDCDGLVDEAYVPLPTSCGVGACANVGLAACVAGVVIDTCAPGAPSASDLTCDGIDDDCDGTIDEDFSPHCDVTAAVHCLDGNLVSTECDDANACNGVESCSLGLCLDGTPPSLDDGNPCTTGTCDPLTGVTHEPVEANTPCSEEDVCAGTARCDADGVCQPGEPLLVDDGNPCTLGICDPVLGVRHEPLPAGASCSDGIECNGLETCDGAGTCWRGPPPVAGPCVPTAPIARFYLPQRLDLTSEGSGTTIHSITGPWAPWKQGGVNGWGVMTPLGGELVLALRGQRRAEDPQLVSSIHLEGGSPEYFARRFEVWVSRTGTESSDFERVLQAELPPRYELQRYEVPVTAARYLKLVLLDANGATSSSARVTKFRVFGPERSGGLLSLPQLGASATASSNPTNASAAHDFFDSESGFQGSAWLSALDEIEGASVTLTLPGTLPHRIDRVAFRPTDGDRDMREYELWVSERGLAPEDFVHVGGGEMLRALTNQWWSFFEPTLARHVRLVVRSNHGARYVHVPDFKVYSADRGGLEATFLDASLPGGDPIVGWSWDFGDGFRSARQHPTHVFPAPGSYLVTLTVMSEYGVTSTTSMVYQAEAGPEAFFTHTPSPVVAGGGVSLTDRSSSDAPILLRVWRRPDGSESRGGEWSLNLNIWTPEPGPAPVSLEIMDAHGRTGRYDDVIEVLPGLPRGESGGVDQTVYWGHEIALRETPFVYHVSPSEIALGMSCSWRFGDGTEHFVTPCRPNLTYPPAALGVTHAYADPGVYEASFTVTDSRGAEARETFFVTVIRRPSVLTLDPLVGVDAAGSHLVRAHLYDELEPSRTLEGRTVTFELDGVEVQATTDAEGTAEATLSFAGGPANVRVRFAGDSHYLPASGDRVGPDAILPARPTNCGTEYLLAFPKGWDTATDPNQRIRPYLFLYGRRPTPARVRIPSLGYSAVVEVRPGMVATVELPNAFVHPPTGEVTAHAVEITAPTEVCVQGMATTRNSSDGFVAIPTSVLGTEYVVGSYGGRLGNTSNFAEASLIVTATVDATSVSILPAVAVRGGPSTPTLGDQPAGVPLTFSLDRGESIELRATHTGPGGFGAHDLTGSLIQASAPVAALSGHACAEVPWYTPACDYLVEQLLPVPSLGQDYLVAPLRGRRGYELRVVAARDDTEVLVDGALVATLDAGQWYSRVHPLTTDEPDEVPLHVQTSEPALVLQYAKGTRADSRRGDPFMMQVIPTALFDNDVYVSTVPDTPERTYSFTNYLGVVIAASEVGGLRLGDEPVTTTFTPFGATGYAYGAIEIPNGSHRLRHVNPLVGFGAYAYGWGVDDSYGYPAALRVVPLGEDDPPHDDPAVSLPNVRPVAYDAFVSTREDVAVSFVLSGFDANGDPITYELLELPPVGVLSGTLPAVTYTPAADWNGHTSFTFRVFDGTEHSLPATVELSVIPQNDAPRFDMAPIVNVQQHVALTLPCVAIDVDDDPDCARTWSLVSGPPGMTIDAATGEIFWLPSHDGTYPVTVRVEDCRGASSQLTFGLVVDTVPSPPVIVSAPVRTAQFGSPYRYDVLAEDPDTTYPDGVVAGYQLLEAPEGMTIVQASGRIDWTPTLAQAGTHTVEVVAFDLTGLFSQPQRFTVTVTGDTTAPIVGATFAPYAILVGETSTLSVSAWDDDDAIIDLVLLDGAPLTLDAAGRAEVDGLAVGVRRVVVEAVDPSGNRGRATAELRVMDGSDTTPPLVRLDTPETDAELTYLHDALGAVFDDHLLEWTVDVRPTDRGEWQTLLRGDQNLDGLLGELDVTRLLNGRYWLRLRAEDVNGQIGEARVPVRVAGGAKLGHVQLSFTDLVLRDVGIPLAVVRRYDSRRAATSGDFGHGWDLELRSGRVQHNRHPGEDILITNPPLSLLGGVLEPCTIYEEQEYHFTEVWLSDDEYYVFRPVLVNMQPLSGSCSADVAYEFVDGSTPGAELAAFGNTTVRARALGAITAENYHLQGQLLDIATGELFNPRSFRLRLRDGRTFDLSTDRGVTRFEDRNGNELYFERNGVIHSSGRAIQFFRDARGRIARIQDSAGREVHYTYDAAGDLVAVQDPLERTMRFEYAAPAHPHHLTSIVDHRGVRSAAFGYQEDGRLRELCDADGVCVESEYDLAARTLVRMDGIGRPTRHLYDQRGRITTAVDGLDHATSYAYQFLSDQLPSAVTDPLGNTTIYERAYDRQRVTAITEPTSAAEDPDDFTTRWTYGSRATPDGRWLTVLESMQLPGGGTLHYDYDDAGNQTAVRDDEDRVVLGRTFLADGRVASTTNRFGTTTYEYSAGIADPTRVIEPGGAVTELEYDALGNVTRVIRGGHTQVFRYDVMGRRVLADYGNGATVRYEYAFGSDDWTAIEGPTFGRVERRMSAAGKLRSWTDPSGDTWSRVYDVTGNLRVETDALGNVRTYTYDDASRLVSVDDAARGATTYTRDAAGRLASTTSPEGHTTTFVRGPRGDATTTTNARGNARTSSAGATSSVSTDALGRTTTSSRTPYGLPSATTFADGASVSRTFDGTTGFESATSFPQTQIDEAGRVRGFAYADGVLQGVTDLAGAGWSYAHGSFVGTDVTWDVQSGEVRLDAPGARSPVSRFAYAEESRDAPRPAALDAWTDRMTSYATPEGDLRTWSHDAATGRLLSTTHTNGAEETFAYDAVSGRRASQTLPDGTTLTFAHDAAGRVVSRSGSDGSSLGWTYAAGGLPASTTDATGTTSYAHDLAGRLTGLTTPSGAVFAQTHDADDRLTSVDVGAGALGSSRRFVTHYGRDPVGHVTTLTDPFGRVTTQTFDDADRLVSVVRPNGVTTTFGYDARDRIVSVEHRDASEALLAASYLTRAAAGEPTRVEREDGSYVLLEVDGAQRITRERYYDAAEVLTSELTYTYDADGNRTSVTRDGVVDTYVYAPGAELLRVERGGAPVQQFTYDAAGRVTRIQRDARVLDLTYDADDHVIALDDSATGETTDFTFDGDGRRVARTVRAGATELSTLRWLSAPNPADGLDSPHLVLDPAADPETDDPIGGYLFDERGPFARVDPATDTLVYYLRDAMGSVIGLVSDDGTEHAAIHYDGFGNLRHATGPLADLPVDRGGDFRFHGMWLEPGTGLYYVRARNYDPQTGRFLSRDPAPGVRGMPETFAPYAFANANPWVWVDLDGRMATLSGQMAAVAAVFTLASVGAAVRYYADRLTLVRNRPSDSGCELVRYIDRFRPALPAYRETAAASVRRTAEYRCRANPIFDAMYPRYAARISAEDIVRLSVPARPRRPTHMTLSIMEAVEELTSLGMSYFVF